MTCKIDDINWDKMPKSLEEFAENLKEDIDEFVKNWEKRAEEDPEIFPEKLTLDEWYAQYDEF